MRNLTHRDWLSLCQMPFKDKWIFETDLFGGCIAALIPV